MGRKLVCDDTVLHVLLVRQSQVLLGRDVAEHGRAEPAYHRSAYGRSDVVVAGRYVGCQWSERIERGFLADL